MEELADRNSAYWADQSDEEFEEDWECLIRDQPQFAKWREGAMK